MDDRSPASTGARSVKQAALDFMRVRPASQLTERDEQTSPSTRRRRAVPSFESLPEYKRVVAQRRAGEQLKIDDPFYRPHQRAAGATTMIDGRDLINFASYDYLGLNQHPTVIEAAKTALDRYAVSASASRLVGGERTIHGELEAQIAKVYGVEAALTFVSGYLTNFAAIGCLMGPEDIVIHDEFIHNSALSGIKLSGATRRFFRHNDLRHLDDILESVSGRYRRTLVIVEGIYSMDGDYPDLPGLITLRDKHGFWLMLDEAHALGVLGENGHGTIEHFGCDPADIDIRMGTLSKTTSACGGYIAGSEALISVLKASAGGFVYSVGLAPALAAAASASLSVMEREPERTQRLKRNGTLFVQKAREAGLDTGLSAGLSVVPIIVGDSIRAAKLSNDLFAEGINVLPIIHPAVPEGHARLRFFITSEHTEEQIGHAVQRTATRLGELEQQNIGVGSVDIAAISALL